MKVILFGATGMVGHGVQRECLLDPFSLCSNRSHNSIATFAIDPINSRLSLLGWTATQGEGPRQFNFDPSGNFLHAGHQNTANIVPFKVDTTTGQLTPNGQFVSTGSPTCILFGSQG